MGTRNCFVLSQKRENSEYNDFIGKYYHFPKKYYKQLSHGNIEFVYYEPNKKGEGIYFGYGKISKLFEDKRESEHYFAEIVEYKPFSIEVPFLDKNNNQRESDPGFNTQNLVRSIDFKLLDELCLDGGILLNFKTDAHLVRILGEQLIASEEVGILELIKNAYDAGAGYCKVRIEKIPTLPNINKKAYLFNEFEGPVIVIEDNGIGMNKNTIENGWLRPAATLKTVIKETLKNGREKNDKTYYKIIEEIKKNNNGRLPLGEKGVGRFATHRLGSKLLIKTKIESETFEYVFKIDWDKFDTFDEDENNNLDEIGISLTRQNLSRDYGERNSGTTIIMYGGKSGFDLSEEKVLKIYETINTIKSPNARTSPTNFDVFFECPQIKDLPNADDILKEFDPIFILDGEVLEDGKFKYSLKFNSPRPVILQSEVINGIKDLRNNDIVLWKIDNKKRLPKCGKFMIKINAWYRSRPWIDGPNIKNFTKYLDAYGGISVFRDGINIFPAEWGTTTDWLGLLKAHIKKGAGISYYNMIGNIDLLQSENIDIIDKTDRQGMIETVFFKDLKILSKACVEMILLPVFQAKRKDLEDIMSGIEIDPISLSNSPKKASQIVDNVLEKYDIEKDPFILLKELGDVKERKQQLIDLSGSLKRLKKDIEAMQEVQELLTEQAGYGVSIGIAVHEISKIASNFYHGIQLMIENKNIDYKQLEDFKSSAHSVRSELNRLAPLRAVRNERPSLFNMMKAIDFEHKLFKKRYDSKNIEIKITGKDFNVFTRFGAINQIFNNLFDNSLYWVQTHDDKNSKIIIHLDSKYRTVIFADSGPGIDEQIKPYVFVGGYSLRAKQSGLGLFICKYYMRTMHGDIYIPSEKERLTTLDGAQFVLNFSEVPEKDGD